MKESTLLLFEQYPQAALIISLLLSIVVAVLGLVPSVFITAANILFFGFWPGTFISFFGELLGALIAFVLYRRGFTKASHKTLARFPNAQRLINAKGKEAFYLVLSLRLLPFVPSGIVTFAAAVGKMSWTTFLSASSIGKMPALLIEAYSVAQVSAFTWQGKLILLLVAVFIIYLIIKKLRSNTRNQ